MKIHKVLHIVSAWIIQPRIKFSLTNKIFFKIWDIIKSCVTF